MKTCLEPLRPRESGIILHLSSLPGPFGIGKCGEEARAFVNRLAAAGVTYWQVLPFTVPGAGFSPYSSTSSFACNTAFIDPRPLVKVGLLTESEVAEAIYGGTGYRTDYPFALAAAERFLRLAFARLGAEQKAEITHFAAREAWLKPYAAYAVIKTYYDNLPWHEWPDKALRRCDKKAVTAFLSGRQNEVDYIYFTQWLFRSQWEELRAYANENGVGVIGDIPIFPDYDSCDVWANTGCFLLDEDLLPTAIAGVPPDYFSADGQLWQNPLYDWQAMAQDGYSWWIDRIRYSLKLYDRIRIDHFRGFESFWAVPPRAKTARVGEWRKGPGMKLFKAVEKALGAVNIIAEDLGDITDEVRQFLQDSGFPGMKVLQFAFDGRPDEGDLPYRYRENTCAYTGTHDNQTTLGWLATTVPEKRTHALDYIGFPPNGPWHEGGPMAPGVRAFMRAVWSSPAFFAGAPLQDVLGYGDDARMNVPGVAEGNWTFRVGSEEFQHWDPAPLKHLNELYGRFTPYRKAGDHA